MIYHLWLLRIAGVIRAQGKRKPLLVTDKMIYSLGLCAALEESLKSENVEYCVYSDVVANPTSENVDGAVKAFKENGCDCLIAFGGGSAMDCAKGAGALIVRPKKTLNDLGGILKVKKKIPMLIAVPTTAGTGSETTLACVVVDSKAAHKKLKMIAIYCGLADKKRPAPEAAATVISKIKEMNAKFGIPEKFDFIERDDINGLTKYADKEANPLYPVPKLRNAKQLEKIYLKVGGYAD